VKIGGALIPLMALACGAPSNTAGSAETAVVALTYPSSAARQATRHETTCSAGMHYEDPHGCVESTTPAPPSAGPPAVTARPSPPGLNDARVRKLDADAMQMFLNAAFDAGVEKLEQALKLCESNRCGGVVHARALIDLGILLVNLARAPDAQKRFIEAIRLDPSTAPDPAFVSPDVERVWKQAQRASMP